VNGGQLAFLRYIFGKFFTPATATPSTSTSAAATDAPTDTAPMDDDDNANDNNNDSTSSSPAEVWYNFRDKRSQFYFELMGPYLLSLKAFGSADQVYIKIMRAKVIHGLLRGRNHFPLLNAAITYTEDEFSMILMYFLRRADSYSPIPVDVPTPPSTTIPPIPPSKVLCITETEDHLDKRSVVCLKLATAFLCRDDAPKVSKFLTQGFLERVNFKNKYVWGHLVETLSAIYAPHLFGLSAAAAPSAADAATESADALKLLIVYGMLKFGMEEVMAYPEILPFIAPDATV
jgi:hypothetical protein